MDKIISLADALICIHDPRIDRTKKHKLVDILIIALCATICGVEGWEEIEIFGAEREDWFKGFLELPNGIPSHDTMYRVFSRIDPHELSETLIAWTQGLNESVDGKIVAIDGKTLRGSFDAATGKGALHMVSAWVEENNLVLGQLACDSKSAEVTNISNLLKMLELKGAIVTIDALGCQKHIVETISGKKADYVIALKANQRNLLEEVKALFARSNLKNAVWESVEKGHGRVESRCCTCIDVRGLMDFEGDGWKNLHSVARIEGTRDVKGKIQEQTRYYISSIPCDAQKIGRAVRAHWGIENTLHWSLDVVFGEDSLRIRKDNAPANLGILRRVAFGLAKARTPAKMTVKRARFRANLNWDFALKHFFKDN